MISIVGAGRILCWVLVLIAWFGVSMAPAAYDDIYNGYGGRAAGMGGALTALADDSSAVFWNPAGLANAKHVEVSQMIGNTMLSAAVLPFRYFTIGLSSYLGLNDSKMNKYVLSLGGFVSNRWQIGANINYGYYKKTMYNDSMKAQGIFLDGGVQYNASDSVSIGAIYRPRTRLGLTQPSLDMYYFTSYFDYIVLPSKIGVGAGYRKGQMAVGIGYDLIEEINDRQSMVMEDDYPNSYQSTMKAGMEYGLFKGHLPLRMGINYSFAHDHPNTSGLLNKSIGLGLKLGGFRFDGAFIFEYDKRNNTDAVGGNFSLGWVFY